MREGLIGQNQDLFLIESMDTWNPSVRGNHTRVFEGAMEINNKITRVAVKLMRHDKQDYALSLFRTEAQILKTMKGIKYKNIELVVPMWECGFIKPEDVNAIPEDNQPGNLRKLKGLVRRFHDRTEDFLDQLEEHVANGWLPYLALEPLPQAQNLLLLCDRAYTPPNRRYFPLKQALSALMQACYILDEAHKRNVVYLDHKIVHYYWDSQWEVLRLMDWNGGQLCKASLSEDFCQEDLRQFTARMAFYLLTGHMLPGALAYIATPEMIAAESAKSYEVKWGYDDRERLPTELRDIIEQALQGQFKNAKALGLKFKDVKDKYFP